MTPEQRSEAAKRAARARWGQAQLEGLAKLVGPVVGWGLSDVVRHVYLAFGSTVPHGGTATNIVNQNYVCGRQSAVPMIGM